MTSLDPAITTFDLAIRVAALFGELRTMSEDPRTNFRSLCVLQRTYDMEGPDAMVLRLLSEQTVGEISLDGGGVRLCWTGDGVERRFRAGGDLLLDGKYLHLRERIEVCLWRLGLLAADRVHDLESAGPWPPSYTLVYTPVLKVDLLPYGVSAEQAGSAPGDSAENKG